MSDAVLTVKNIAKCYPTYRSPFSRFARWFGAPIKPLNEFWAVKDVSFSVGRGEAVAVIGQNGAGKSTLLKLVTGTVRQNHGTIRIKGRVSAILELGLGFNPELTGRENVAHSGGLIGFSADDLRRLMPSIEEFAEIGAFFDKPLRTYSSGMQARLAFALATCVRPQILIVDEVLSVGDSYFQHKSFDRIRKFKEQGSSILLVTHSMGDVRSLCDRVLLMDKGKIVRDGAPDEVVEHYNALIAEKENAKLTVEQRRSKGGWLHSEYGSREAEVEEFELLDAETLKPVSTAFVGQKLVVQTTALMNQNIDRLILGHRITDRAGHIVWGSNTWHSKQVVDAIEKGERITYQLRFTCALGPGSYALNFGLVSSDTHLENCYHKAENRLVFDVINADRPIFIGSNALDAKFEVTRKARSDFTRVAIVSTPRSGNTWFRYMLAQLYGATQLVVHTPDEIEWKNLPDGNLVLQLHWPPTDDFRRQLRAANFEIVTITRHPFDVLISILNFSPNEPQTARWLDGEGGDESAIHAQSCNSDAFITYAKSPRARALLSVSSDWLKQGETVVVSYEKLVADTIGELESLAKNWACRGRCKRRRGAAPV